MKRKIFGILIFILSFIFSYGKENTLIVGTNAAFVPFEYMEKGDIVGFDIDLVNKIGEKIGKKIIVKDMTFDGLIPSLQSKKIDLIIAGLSKTKEREKFVDFSEPYFVAKQVILTKDNNSIGSLNDLKNKKIGVVLGYTGDILATKNSLNNKIQYDSTPGAIIGLLTDKIDGIIIDSAPGQMYQKKNKGIKVIEINSQEEQYAIAIGKNQKELLNSINKALKEIKEEGYYDELLTKYFK